MTRTRLRPAHSPAALRKIYATPHDHRRWRDHHLRVAATIEVARWLAGGGVRSAADLSCGDGAILSAVPAKRRIFGDVAPGHEFSGPIEATIEQIDPVDLFVCAETIEHLDDPDLALKGIRGKTSTLILSTPVEAWNDTNPEHYWAWSRGDVEQMLTATGFSTVVYSTVDFRPHLPYCFGIWGAA